MRLFTLNKIVLSLTGQEVESFLNGLTANRLDAPRNAFVNIHGRIVATFDQVKIYADEYWIVIAPGAEAALKAHLERYLGLSGITLKRKDCRVYFDLTGEYSLGQEEIGIPQRKGKIVITEKTIPPMVTEEEFTAFRLAHNIPLHGVDYTDEMLLNVSETEHVSFAKGCFLGQEPLSKVHNRSKPTWALVVKKEEDCSAEELARMTSKARNPGQAVQGFVFVKNTGLNEAK